MSPRSSIAAARETRARIVAQAVDVASAEGFDSVSLGRLATDLAMSKAGVVGPFGSLEALEQAALHHAIETFRHAVWQPAEGERAGLPRLLAVCDLWVAYLTGRSYVGLCLTSAEHHGSASIRTSVARAMKQWRAALAHDVACAIAQNEIEATRDPEDVAFALNSIALGAGQARRLRLDADVSGRAKREMHRALGLAK